MRPRQNQAIIHDNGGTDYLADQLLIRLDVKNVVDQSYQKQERRGPDDHPFLAGVTSENEIGNDYCEPNRDSAQHGRGPLVPAIDLWSRHIASASRKRA